MKVFGKYLERKRFKGILEKVMLFHCYAQKYYVTSKQRTWTQRSVNFGIVFIIKFGKNYFQKIMKAYVF